MDKRRIVRAWRDEEYRETLGDAVPEHPAGLMEIPDSILVEAAGGSTELMGTGGCCQGASDTCTMNDVCSKATDTCNFTT